MRLTRLGGVAGGRTLLTTTLFGIHARTHHFYSLAQVPRFCGAMHKRPPLLGHGSGTMAALEQQGLPKGCPRGGQTAASAAGSDGGGRAPSILVQSAPPANLLKVSGGRGEG